MASNAGSGPGDVFDVRKVRRFIELMNEHDLSEIDLRQGDQRIRLRRGPEMVTVAARVAPLAPTAAARRQSAAAEQLRRRQPPARTPTRLYIRSPMVGTFYAAASPDSPPFVKVGDQRRARIRPSASSRR